MVLLIFVILKILVLWGVEVVMEKVYVIIKFICYYVF